MRVWGIELRELKTSKKSCFLAFFAALDLSITPSALELLS